MRILGHVLACVIVIMSAPASAQVREPLDFTPLTPCRAFDTRAKAPIATQFIRTFYVAGSRDLSFQGGPTSGCFVPVYATAVQLTLTAVNATGTGYALAYPADRPRPTIVGTTYNSSDPTASSSIVPLGAEDNQAGNIFVYVTRQTHVIGDVTGYFTPKLMGRITAQGGLQRKTSGVLSGERVSTGLYKITINRGIGQCEVFATSNSANIFVAGLHYSPTSAGLRAYRVTTDGPVPTDANLYFNIVCQ